MLHCPYQPQHAAARTSTDVASVTAEKAQTLARAEAVSSPPDVKLDGHQEKEQNCTRALTTVHLRQCTPSAVRSKPETYLKHEDYQMTQL